MSERPLDGKIALVTGSYRRLGAVTAEMLARYGAHVVIHGRLPVEQDESGRETLARIFGQGVEGRGIAADLARGDEVRRLCREALSAFGRIDILVNSAGPFSTEPYLKLPEAKWDEVMDVNVKAIYLTAQELAPQMKANGWGRIINVGAAAAYVRNPSVYFLAKVVVQVITESLALELAPEVTVNNVAPGQIEESLADRHEPSAGERARGRTPTQRLISRQEVAEMIALMCMSPFANVTGATITMDGGGGLPRL